jgi:glycosyltransferase involved in cell wall biosynthesis
MSQALASRRVAIVSRCSWTLRVFRRPLMRAIEQRGAHVSAYGAEDGTNERHLLSEGFDFRAVPVALRSIAPIADVRLLLKLMRVFRETRPSIVHSFTVKPSIYATIAAELAGVPVRVVTITGLGHAFTTASFPLRHAVAVLYRFALARASLVIFQNPDDRRLFTQMRLVDDERCRTILGSGVDTEHFAPAPLPLQSGQSPMRVLMIARLLKEKGVTEYLRAAEILRERGVAIRMTLLGGIDARNPASLGPTDLERLRNSRDVEWIDTVDDVRPHIRSADVVALPSYREGLPKSLLEAASMGRAIVTTDVPGCREVIENGTSGLLIPAADASALANALASMAADPARVVSMGASARRRAVELFAQDLVIDRVLAEYERLLNGDGKK